MSQPPVSQTDTAGVPEGAAVQVPIQAILQNVHGKYLPLIETLIQENAQLQAGIEAQGRELAYLRSVAASAEANTRPGVELLGAMASVGAEPLAVADDGQGISPVNAPK